jgi:hypothetical protein
LGSVERSVIIRGDYCFTVATDDNAEDRFEDGHLLLLSDLLLICRTKTQDEISRNVDGNISTHWLLFPPLAVRHVIATDATQADQGNNNFRLYNVCPQLRLHFVAML